MVNYLEKEMKKNTLSLIMIKDKTKQVAWAIRIYYVLYNEGIIISLL